MIRSIAMDHIDHDPEFRWRGEQVSRIENLSDIVFAIAMGMIVSASSPPTTFDGLHNHLVGIVPAAFSFIVMLLIWNDHFTFFRRYNLADRRVVFLNACLLLLVLFIAYPLRFVFDSLFAYILGTTGDWSRTEQLGLDVANKAAVITAYFGVGFGAIRVVFAMLYAHAYSRRDTLELTPHEIVLTKREIFVEVAEILIAGVVVAAALKTPLGPFAGFGHFLNFVMPPVARLFFRKEDKSLEVPTTPEVV